MVLFTKSERETLLQEIDFPIFEDESNSDMKYTRNRIRHNVCQLLFQEGLDPDKLYWNFHNKEWVHSETLENSNIPFVKVHIPKSISISSFKKLVDTYLQILQLYPIKRKLIEEVYSQWTKTQQISKENVEAFFWKSERSDLFIIPKDSPVLKIATQSSWNDKKIDLSPNQTLGSCKDFYTIFHKNKHFQITELMRERQIPTIVREFIPLIIENGQVLRICFHLWDDNLSDFPKA